MTIINQDTFALKESTALSLQGIDYVELYVGNPKQAAHYYQTTFGFVPVAYAGLETGLRDRTSYVMRNEECSLLLTGPLQNDGPVARYIARHGDGVKDIAFRVQDVRKAYTNAVRSGAEAILEPTVLEDETGSTIKATVSAFGDVVHSFIQRDHFAGTFLPSFEPLPYISSVPWTGLYSFDHFAVCLPQGELQRWVAFYKQVFGFQQIHSEGIATEYSAMNSIAVKDCTGDIKFVLMEPIAGKRKSQIEEFLRFHQGPGVQHLALHSQDIVKTIDALETNGVTFVKAPASYYEMLPDRIGSISESVLDLRRTNILADRDEWGYLLQIFSQPVQSRPTLFIEIIQRKAARGFGSGNIQALFKAVEREQAKRGNL